MSIQFDTLRLSQRLRRTLLDALEKARVKGMTNLRGGRRAQQGSLRMLGVRGSQRQTRTAVTANTDDKVGSLVEFPKGHARGLSAQNALDPLRK